MNLALAEIGLPLRLHPDRPLTDEALLRFCASNEPMQVEREPNGDLIIMSPTWSDTSSKNSNLIYQLYKWAEETGSGQVFESNAGFTLPDGSMRSPDAAWISWTVWNALPAERQRGFARICPQLIVELRSDSDLLTKVQEKMRQWIANGAELGWLIDPESKTVEVYRPGREPEVQEGQSAVYGEGPVVGFVLELGRIWG
jgi:Uma2 family endonuclease